MQTVFACDLIGGVAPSPTVFPPLSIGDVHLRRGLTPIFKTKNPDIIIFYLQFSDYLLNA